MNGAPLKSSELSADSFEEAVVHTILKMTQDLQRAVYNVSVEIKKFMIVFI